MAGSGSAWSRERTPAATTAASHEGTQQALRQLLSLRIAAPIAQFATVLVATRHYGVVVPERPVFSLLAIGALLALATCWRIRRSTPVGVPELFLHAQLDVVLFAAMLYFTGGASNPFAPMFLLPMVITASALPARWVWVTALITVGAYLALSRLSVPLVHPDGPAALYALTHRGAVVSYVLAAALLAFFVTRTHAALRRGEHRLAFAREAQMRDEYVTSIGELATRCAHELGSPLSTMAVVVTELMREHGGNAALLGDLRLVNDQIRVTKQIVSNLASAAGQRRAEAAGGAKLDRFLHGIVERARALNPGATITESLDGHTPAPCVLAEETLRQAVTSLIEHAVHASPQHVRVSADWSGSDLRVVVRDRGPGFPSELLQRVGKPLDGAHGDLGANARGLLLSAITLHRLGGLLELRNEPRTGGSAELRLPLATITIEHRKGGVPDGQPA